MRVSRGLPSPSRRRVATTVAVVASGGLVTVAMAAGPVVYSEYTQDGDREARVALPDGGDFRLPRTVGAASVSPDGRRIAQVGGTRTITSRSTSYASWLRVTGADGRDPVTVVEERSPGPGRPPERVVGGHPVWSPDGTRVLLQVTSLRDGLEYGRTERLLCVVDARSCSRAGRIPGGRIDGGRFDTDVVGWQAQQGPLRRVAPASGGATPTKVRCGGGAGSTPQPDAAIAAVDPAGGFGPALRLRGVPRPDTGEQDPDAAGVAAVADGTLALDAPQAATVRGRLRCSGRSAGYRVRVRKGPPRLRLRTAGTDVVLPTPPGLHASDGLALVALSDGGAALLTREPIRDARGTVACAGRARVRRCYPGDVDLGSGAYVDPDSWTQRVWRLRPGARSFERVTTASRVALKTLHGAATLAPTDDGAVLAVEEERIERVPLDGGAPTVVARGHGLSLDLERP